MKSVAPTPSVSEVSTAPTVTSSKANRHLCAHHKWILINKKDYSLVKVLEIVREAAREELRNDIGRQPCRSGDRYYFQQEDPCDHTRVDVVLEHQDREQINHERQQDWRQYLPLQFLDRCENIEQLDDNEGWERDGDDVGDVALREDENGENDDHRALINTHWHPDEECLEWEATSFLQITIEQRILHHTTDIGIFIEYQWEHR